MQILGLNRLFFSGSALRKAVFTNDAFLFAGFSSKSKCRLRKEFPQKLRWKMMEGYLALLEMFPFFCSLTKRSLLIYVFLTLKQVQETMIVHPEIANLGHVLVILFRKFLLA